MTAHVRLSDFAALAADRDRFRSAYKSALRDLEKAEAERDRLAPLANCGGVNCGKCQQCLTVNLHFAMQAVDNLRADRDRLAKALRNLMNALSTDTEGVLRTPFEEWSVVWVAAQEALASLSKLDGEA